MKEVRHFLGCSNFAYAAHILLPLTCIECHDIMYEVLWLWLRVADLGRAPNAQNF